MTKNGIPLDIPGQSKKLSKVQVQKPQSEFNKFYKFATMVGFEEGCHVTAVVPMGHPDFKTFLNQGYVVIDIWINRDQKEESA